MVDIIYNFIWLTLFNETELTGAQELAILLTYTTIVIILMLLYKLVVWAFNISTLGLFKKTR